MAEAVPVRNNQGYHQLSVLGELIFVINNTFKTFIINLRFINKVKTQKLKDFKRKNIKKV